MSDEILEMFSTFLKGTLISTAEKSQRVAQLWETLRERLGITNLEHFQNLIMGKDIGLSDVFKRIIVYMSSKVYENEKNKNLFLNLNLMHPITHLTIFEIFDQIGNRLNTLESTIKMLNNNQLIYTTNLSKNNERIKACGNSIGELGAWKTRSILFNEENRQVLKKVIARMLFVCKEAPAPYDIKKGENKAAMFYKGLLEDMEKAFIREHPNKEVLSIYKFNALELIDEVKRRGLYKKILKGEFELNKYAPLKEVEPNETIEDSLKALEAEGIIEEVKEPQPGSVEYTRESYPWLKDWTHNSELQPILDTLNNQNKQYMNKIKDKHAYMRGSFLIVKEAINALLGKKDDS